MNVFSIPSSGSGDVYIGNIKVRLPVPTWNLPSVVRLDMVQTVANSVSNLKASDSAPGGFTNFGFPEQAKEFKLGNTPIKADFGTKTKGLWCFIPTFSAFDIPEPTNFFQSFDCASSSANRCIASISADAFSTDIGAVGTAGGFAHNQDHVTINQRNYTFLLDLIRDNGAGLNIPSGGILTRTFNYGRSSQAPTTTQSNTTPNVIDKSITVNNTGAIWINRAGKIAFTDENNLQNQSNATFNVQIVGGLNQCLVTASTVTLQNNGSLWIGDPSVNNIGNLSIGQGGILNIKNNGVLRIENNSQLIVENGGKLIIEAGANINLVGTDSKIVIRDGGELIINGQPSITGNRASQATDTFVLSKAIFSPSIVTLH